MLIPIQYGFLHTEFFPSSIQWEFSFSLMLLFSQKMQACTFTVHAQKMALLPLPLLTTNLLIWEKSNHLVALFPWQSFISVWLHSMLLYMKVLLSSPYFIAIQNLSGLGWRGLIENQIQTHMENSKFPVALKLSGVGTWLLRRLELDWRIILTGVTELRKCQTLEVPGPWL